MPFADTPPLPPAPDVHRVDKDGKPTVAWTDYERRLTEFLKRLAGYVSVAPVSAFSPTSSSIAAAGAVGRTIATFSQTGGTSPYAFTIVTAAGVAAAFTGNVLKSTANPIGSVGAHAMSIRVSDALSGQFVGTFTLTLT
jgi:hypothetical protein